MNHALGGKKETAGVGGGGGGGGLNALDQCIMYQASVH